ncbi:uncharacterized protein N7482_005436 [Penicillium canariense]|uniref:Zn(2)-C6 fungal-type domain-containing protein n=1 Tax=Penicillium canariense TaxID=189055 RepID=A0A9W9I4V4_9EURO|nr:uncharacterized protein N7482_005436 [Penicillium canariense]KAJ5166655.1 hypothetical protein N7482_005436 [Penicillium canariense]
MSAISDTGWRPLLPVVSGTSPSNKKGRSRQSGTPWTRSGCITCKKRRKACDKAKPSCNNCLKQGRACEGYGDLWVAPLGPSAQVFKQIEVPKRRRLSGSSPSQPLSPSPSLNSDSWQDTMPSPRPLTPGWSLPSTPPCRVIDLDVDESSEGQNLSEQKVDTSLHVQNSLAVVPRPQGFVSHLSGHESHYLQYHMEFGSRLLANLESEHNPLRSFLIPRAMSSPLLMKALCAVSALHLANRSYGLEAQTAAASFYGRTLSGLRTALADEILSDDAVLAVGLMCKYEIIRGSVKQWVVHLSALQRLIASRGGLGSMDQEAAHFLRGLYVYAYNMGRISNRKRITYAPADTDIGTPRLDIYIGYTEEILNLCARIAELPSLEGDDISLRLSIASINDSLLTWTPSSIRFIIPQDLTQETLRRLQLVAECFRDAGFIYLHSILKRMSMKGSPIPHLAKDTPYLTDWSPLITTPKSTAIQRLLARIQTFPLDDHCEYSALTFPLFIAGCESDVFDHRDLVLQSLGKLQVNFGIGNVRRAKDVLAILWARQDASPQDRSDAAGTKLHWIDILEELQWELNLA